MKNEISCTLLDSDFKKVYIRVTETNDKTRLLIKKIQPNEFRTNNKTLKYSEEPKHEEGYINLHMHLCRLEDIQSPNLENNWVLEDTRVEKCGYKTSGHFKPVKFDPEVMSGYQNKVVGFFATTDLVCLKFESFYNKKLGMAIKSRIQYEIPKEFIKAYAESKGNINSAMVQPINYAPQVIKNLGKTLNRTKYLKDIDGYIAIFPSIPYNSKILADFQ